MSKRYHIDREEVVESWKAVCRSAGGPGIDGQTIESMGDKLDGELYKIWNRMSSGSYQAQPVQIISIPKAKGGTRKLGIPTVSDRTAQGIIKNRLEKVVDTQFHQDSYAYRPGKSAVDAVLKARTRCMQQEWVVEIDIKGFFDNLDHDLMLGILKKYTNDKLVLLYSRKFLQAPGVNELGETIVRDKGTPQGGVLSPVLANLYLHESFDQWMVRYYPNISFERYADDIIIHCKSEEEGEQIRQAVMERLQKFNLELHPEKTRVVYAGKRNDYDKRGHKLSRKFTFLGYDFKPRKYKGRTVFTPGMGKGALLMMNKKLKSLRIESMIQGPLEIMAKMVNTISRGWINYYGHARRSELYKLATLLDNRIVKFLAKKHKMRSVRKAWELVRQTKKKCTHLFAHWYMIAKNPLRAV